MSSGHLQSIKPPVRASFAQERLWFIEAMDPGSAIYNQLICYRIRGSMDLALLQAALQVIIGRHEALRTNLFLEDGLVYQSVSAAAPVEVRHSDISAMGCPGSIDSIEAARRLLMDEARRPFDLATEHLIRPYLLQLGEGDVLLGLITHHTIMDGWSMGIMIKELSCVYESLSSGDSPSLPQIPLQYDAHSVRQRDAFTSGNYDDQLRYWLERLGGDMPVLQLPLDHPRPETQPFMGRSCTVVIPPDLSAALKALGKGEKATLFMTLLAAYIVLIYRDTHQENIIVGYPVAGRNSRDIEGIVGLFVNTLTIRPRISSGQTYSDLLRQVKALALEAYDNQDLPFEKLVERLSVHRSLNISPVFQTLFQLRNFPVGVTEIAGHPLERFEFDDVMVKTDLTLEVTETGNGLSCRFEYPVALFDRETIDRMCGHWRTLLEDIVRNPSKELSELRIMPAEELSTVQGFSQGPCRDYPRNSSISSLFEACARRCPDAVALRQGSSQVTYDRLNRYASHLACRLQAAGIMPGENVAVLMERSAGSVAAVVAVIKAGCAYVPLDPEDTDGRIAEMIEAADVRAIISETGLSERAEKLASRTLLVDDGWLHGAIPETGDPQNGAGPDTLAYIMFTSGSTGKPKGVCIPHRGVARLVLDTDYVTIAPGDVVAHMANPAFDAATFEIWGALLNGAVLVIIDRETALSPDRLSALISESHLDVMFVTTPFFNLVATEFPAIFCGVRDLLVGGDVLEPGPAALVLGNGPPGRLLNAYGPTENTTFSAWYHVNDIPAPLDIIPIGRPIANTTLYILDERLQPVPIGVAGEICLAGDGLSTGYRKRPDMIAGRFVPDPFFRDGSRMMYRTGDLGRYLPDGNVQFLGRADGQVKIRGFRVEMGEIVSAFETHPAVRKAVVTVFNGPGGMKALAAYLLAAGGHHVETSDVQRFVSHRLPPYMLPASITWIEAFPLTPRGKIDYDALPAPAGDVAAAGCAHSDDEDGGDEIVQKMAALWGDVLGVAGVAADDNFFSLGGHSLLAIRLVGRIEKVFGVKLPVSALFRTPTVRQLAESVKVPAKGVRAAMPVALQPEGHRLPVYCVHGAAGTVFEYDVIARHAGTDQPLFGLQSPGLDGLAQPLDNVDAMASACADEVLAHRPHGPYGLLAYCAAAPVAYETARKLAAAGEKVAFLGIIDYMAPKQDTTSLHWSCYRFLRDNLDGLALHVGRFYRAGTAEKARSITHLPAFLLHKVIRTPREITSDPAAVNKPQPEFPGWILDYPEPLRTVATKNYRAIADYVPGKYEGDIVLFMSTERARIQKRTGRYERTFGWRTLSGGSIDVHIIDSDHNSIINEKKNAQYIASVMRRHIDKYAGESGNHGRSSR